ncbi:MAG: ABC transporter ATP-binding protein [Planctomycetota bacterium]|nr:ABC transporter ATP-binding protein [Planctomycetota bacterium]
MAAIETHELTKIYRSGTVGISGLTLRVETGRVAGFVGPNGAGKTTTIRLLLDLLRPTAGSARVLGLDPVRASVKIRRATGYLPSDLVFYDSLSGRDTLAFLTRLRGGSHRLRNDLLDAVALSRADLGRRVGTYSTGMRKKLGLVAALQHDPELAFLDEPTTGLDPLVRRRCHEAISSWHASGRTLFLSSHDILEVERLCDEVFIVRDGRLMQSSSMADLLAEKKDARSLEDLILSWYETA